MTFTTRETSPDFRICSFVVFFFFFSKVWNPNAMRIMYDSLIKEQTRKLEEVSRVVKVILCSNIEEM